PAQPERAALHRGGAVPDLEAETRRSVDIQPSRPLLESFELLDGPKVLALDDDRILHAGRDHDAFEHLAAHGKAAVERTLAVRANLRGGGDVNADVACAGCRWHRRRGRLPSLLLLRHEPHRAFYTRSSGRT